MAQDYNTEKNMGGKAALGVCPYCVSFTNSSILK